MLYTIIEQKSRKNQTNTLKHTAKMKWYKKTIRQKYIHKPQTIQNRSHKEM